MSNISPRLSEILGDKVASQLEGLRAMLKEEHEDLAQRIIERFTPFAFNCQCDEESCVKVRTQDRYAIGQYHTVQMIAQYIREQA